MSEKDDLDKNVEPGSGTSAVEWVVAALGALILVSMIGYMLFYGLTQQSGPPRIVLEAGAVTESAGGYLVEFTARNEGPSTAAALHIKGQLMDGAEILEEAEAQLDYVPEHSKREGGMFFDQDPREHTLVLSSEGYSKP